MKTRIKIFSFALLALLAVTCSKKNGNKNKETIIAGKMTLLVDETLVPIVEDQVQIFEDKYNAKITLDPKSESEVIQTLANDSSRVAVLTRKLNAEEEKLFKSKKIFPKVTKIATDAIVLIANKNNKDTLVALQDVIDFMQQKPSKIKGLVFDNPNSSTARYINDLAHISGFPNQGVFSFKTNDEAIKYVAENEGMIGVVGLNWLSQPSPEMQPYVGKVNILYVKGATRSAFIYPSQNDIAEGKYPLARDLYIVNCQAYSGLGMGFGSFVTSEIGQRIILKSGLVPAKTPGRKIHTRNSIEK